MKHPSSLALFTVLLGACVNVADAQPRHPARHPAPPAHPDAGAVTDGGARDTRWVVQRGRGAWQPRCVATTGCAAPRAIPRCAAGMSARTFAEAVDQRFGLSGQTVSVRGHLSAGGGCTEMGCPDGACCNHCSGDVALTGVATTSLRRLSLGDNDPAFACTGDDSGLCCGTEVVTGEVVATGVLRPVPNSGGAWRVEAPRLCAM